jgi:glycosyltransferase involved in cell wall biosynthesis
MSEGHPTISVVIPAYRCADSIGDVLEALFNQTLAPSEIIVVNDCSPDNLNEVLAPYEDRIIHLHNATNLRLSKSYNRGIGVARGEYILTLHSDCVLEPDYLEKIFSLLHADASVGAVTGQYQFHNFEDMDLSDQLFSVLNRLPVETPQNPEPVEEISFIEGKADLFRRADLEAFGGFCENLTLTNEDQDLSAKYRSRGFRLLQANAARFASKYNGTQDSIGKVLRKQWTYARGQAYILLEYGSHAVKKTTSNRNVRVVHRISQLLGSALEIGLLGASLAWPWATLALGAVLLQRSVYYFQIAGPMRMPLRFRAIPCGLLADHFYFFGMLNGAYLYYTVRKI